MSFFKRISVLLAVCTLGLALGGCWGGAARYSEMRDKISPLSTGEGRIYIYRPAFFGAEGGFQPDVKINGQVVGGSVNGSFYYVDRPPGNYVITTSMEAGRSLSLTLESGQTRYVRVKTRAGFGIPSIYPELVDEAEGQREIVDLHYWPK